MKQKFIRFFILTIVLAMPRVAVAYDFSAVAPSGQMLYYNINFEDGYAEVTNPPRAVYRPTGDLIIPSSITYLGQVYPVTAIGDEAFDGCVLLTSVVIPDSVTYIGDYAFGGCSGLTAVNIPDSVTYIGDGAFGDCSGLTAVNIPDATTHIGSYAFYGCSGLTSVHIGRSIRLIDYFAFRK